MNRATRYIVSGLFGMIVLGGASSVFAAPKAPTATAKPAAPVAEEQALPEGDIRLMRREVDEIVKRFTERTGEYGADIKEIIEDQFEQRDAAIDAKYEAEVGKLEGEENEFILAAIARIEAFVARYKNEPAYTPDAMFRLAELHYLKAKREFSLVREKLLREYERQLALYDENKIDLEPKPPHPDYKRTIALYREIASRFPTYRYTDAVYYLMAYSYQEEGDLPQVRWAFENLIALAPQSRFVPEAYLRIGDAFFNELKYEEAVLPLSKAAEAKDSPYYDQILYKLASTQFILFKSDEAVRTFSLLNDYSEKVKAKSGQVSDFRAEAVKYIAFCYAQDLTVWPNGGIKNAVAYFDALNKDPLGQRPWEADVFRELGNYYSLQLKWDDAIVAYKRVLAKDPWAAGNPDLQNKVIAIYIRQNDEANQYVERENLIKNYGEGSAWAEHNADNPDAVAAARTLALNALKQWAYFQHAQAQKYKSLGQTNEAQTYYAKAAAAYRTFIARFPHDKEAYELTFRLADALFFSGNYKDAVAEYLKVRDSKMSSKFFADSAYAVVLCFDNLSGQKGVDLTLSDEEAQAKQRERLKGKTEMAEIPELSQKYIDAIDFYVARVPDAKEKEKIAYNAAGILFDHNHLDEARKRYVDFVNSYPANELAPKAARRIIDTYLLANDFVKVTEWSEKLASLELGSGEERSKMRAALKEIKGNAMAQYAKELESRKEYEKAAEQYIKAVAEDRTSADAPRMLFNAAANYQKANRPLRAMDLYQELVDRYPKAEFASEALYYVADSAYSAYNLEKAAASYAKLYTEYPNIDPKVKCQAIFNHAQLSEFNHDYKKATAIFEKYPGQCEAIDPNAPSYLFKAGEIYGRMDDAKNMIRVYQDFIKRYGETTTDYQRNAIQAYGRIAEYYAARKQTRETNDYYKKAIAYFDSHPAIASDFTANNLAGKAAFALVEPEFEVYKNEKIQGANNKQLKEWVDRKINQVKELTKAYTDVKRFKSPEYYLASSMRVAEVGERFADALFGAPVPKEVKALGEEAVDIYMQQIADQTDPLYRKAAEAYQQALEAGKGAKLFGSPWMKRIYQALARPNIKAVATERFTMRKPEKNKSVPQSFILPLSPDTGAKHEAVKPKPAEESGKPAEQPAAAGAAN